MTLCSNPIILTLLSLTFVQAFHTRYCQVLTIRSISNTQNDHLYSKNFLSEIWEEFVEFSTYGPSERRLLKAKRDAAAKSNNQALTENDSDEAWQNAFNAIKSISDDDETNLKGVEYDGYSLRDLIVTKWGVPLDVDFQRIPGVSSIYCTILPFVGYDSRKSRHDSELDYLMHLQGVVEILHKYDNLDAFIGFIETTNKVPKPGTDSVPFRLSLSEEQLRKIMPNV